MVGKVLFFTLMRRFLLENLKEWKDSTQRMPLLLLGARQVGKTWALREFGRVSFSDVAYFSLDQDPGLNDFFAKTKDPLQIIDFLGLVQGKPIIPGKTLGHL
jgi:uncharacterized protein